jgi:DNA-directed RNA polymerase specialized sigma24 family protein
MRRSPAELQEDVIGDVILKLIKNDAAALITYQDKGKPFFAWLWAVAENRFKTIIQRSNREEAIDEVDAEGKPKHELIVPDQDYGEETQRDIVWIFARRLDPDCLLGLIGQYVDGWHPRDLVFLLGRTGPKANVKVSARLTYCLEVLRKMIFRAGFRPEDFQF